MGLPMLNKNSKYSKLKVGITVIIGLLIFFLFIFLVGSEGNYFSSTYHLNILMNDTQGLTEGGSVSLGGLKIGHIDKIEFTSVNNQNLVKLRLAILEKYSSQITINSYAKISTLGLLGDKLINLSLGNPSEKPLSEGEYLPVRESVSFESITQKIEPAIENINRIFENLKAITDTISQGKGSIGELVFNSSAADRLNSSLVNLESFSSSLNKQDGTIGKLIYSDELYDNLSLLTMNLKMMTDSIQTGKGTLGQLIKNDSLYNNLNDLTENLKNASKSLNSDSTMLGGLINDTESYKQITSLINELNKLIIDLKDNPDKYINLSIF